MKRLSILVALVVAAVSALGFPPSSERQPNSRLPGARVIIDAAHYPTLQAAFDALPEEGGLVQLPAGEFEITSPLRVRRGDVCILGAGTATHIKNMSRKATPALVLAHADHGLAGNEREKDLWRIRVSNLRISGTERTGPGIVAYNVNEVLLDHVSVSHHGGDGIQLNFCYEDPRISSVLLTYNAGAGIHLFGCHDIVVASSQFEENQDALHCFDGFNLCMTGNCVDDHIRHGVVIENTYGSVVSGNMIEECIGTAIVLDRDCYGITLSSNVIAHNGGGIDLRDAHGCAISANTFTIVKEDAVRVGPKSGRIGVSANSFSSSYIGDGVDKRRPDDRTAAGMVLEGTAGVFVGGNLFSGVGPLAIDVRGDQRQPSLIRNNLIVDAKPGIATDAVRPTTQQNFELPGDQ